MTSLSFFSTDDRVISAILCPVSYITHMCITRWLCLPRLCSRKTEAKEASSFAHAWRRGCSVLYMCMRSGGYLAIPEWLACFLYTPHAGESGLSCESILARPLLKLICSLSAHREGSAFLSLRITEARKQVLSVMAGGPSASAGWVLPVHLLL